MSGNGSGRKSVAHRAADRFEQFIEGGQVWVALACGAVLIALQVPGVEEVLDRIGLENDTRVRTAFGVVLLGSILLELRQLKRSVTPVASGWIHYQNRKAMYNALIETAEQVTEPEHRQIEVLGLTLFSAWPELESFLETPGVEGWTVKLATLSKSAAPESLWVPDGWPEESEAIVRQVLIFKAGQGTVHDHEIEVFEYELPPAVHGFRLGNGDIFISTLRWQDEDRLGKHRFPYDYVPAHDLSPAATDARALFRSWFDQAVRSHLAATASQDQGEAGTELLGEAAE
jgi:uncharacterized membrane protein